MGSPPNACSQCSPCRPVKPLTVRVAPNLLRPSHFFGLLQRRDDEGLRECVRYYADREVRDGRWPVLKSEREKFATWQRESPSTSPAPLQCSRTNTFLLAGLGWGQCPLRRQHHRLWLVRQFGLYHHDYRFEDTDRMSTSIPEQKRKARQIVQRFIQIRELLLTGERPALTTLANDDVLDLFDREFEIHKRRLFLRQVGFDETTAEKLRVHSPPEVETLLRLHNRLERKRSSVGRKPVATACHGTPSIACGIFFANYRADSCRSLITP